MAASLSSPMHVQVQFNDGTCVGAQGSASYTTAHARPRRRTPGGCTATRSPSCCPRAQPPAAPTSPSQAPEISRLVNAKPIILADASCLKHILAIFCSCTGLRGAAQFIHSISTEIADSGGANMIAQAQNPRHIYIYIYIQGLA